MKIQLASNLLPRLIEGVCYGSTVVLAVLALMHPENYQTFWNQNFEFWLAAEFISIHSVGFLSGASREGKISVRTKFLLLTLYALFILVITTLYAQWIFGAIMLGYLVLRVYKIERVPDSTMTDVAVRTLIFLFCMFTAMFVIALLEPVFPEFRSTSNPVYMDIMGDFGGAVWLLYYYTLLTFTSFLGLFTLRKNSML